MGANLSPSPPPAAPVLKRPSFESTDYEDHSSAVALAEIRTKTRRSFATLAALRWVVVFLVGLVVGILAVGIIFSTRFLSSWKFGVVTPLIDRSSPPWAPFSAYLGINLLFALIASLVVLLIEPLAAASGIPELKTLLNGVHIPGLLRAKTMLTRVVGVVFSVASGLPVGYEGPMSHVGASVGSILSQGKTRLCGVDTRGCLQITPALRNSRERRDFAVSGAAAGIAAAFFAPIGAVLFLLEESASFWPKSLTWRSFFAAMVSAYTIGFLLTGLTGSGSWGELTKAGMFSFGDFNDVSANDSSSRWQLFELPAFVGLGALAGMLGSGFNYANAVLTRWRQRKVSQSKRRKLVEVLAVTAVVSAVSFFAPLVFGTCLPRPSPDSTPPASPASPQSKSVRSLNDSEYSLVSMYCPPDEYNDLASLFFAPSEEAIRMLFHLKGSDAFPLPHLAGFFLSYFVLMCVALGLALPSGLFIPSILAGSALGRLVGQGLDAYTSLDVDPGTYAWVGGAAMLGGLTRMTISLAVILLECTGNYFFGLPLMLALMSSRWVGNWLTRGVYDQAIVLRGLPLLEEQPPKTLVNELRTCDVMTPSPLVFREVEKVGRVLGVLQSCTHNGFPVVYGAEMMRAHPRLGTLAGYIQRKHLLALLAKKAFHKDLPFSQPWEAAASQPGGQSKGGGGEEEQQAAQQYQSHHVSGGGGGPGTGEAGRRTSSGYSSFADAAAAASSGSPSTGGGGVLEPLLAAGGGSGGMGTLTPSGSYGDLQGAANAGAKGGRGGLGGKGGKGLLLKNSEVRIRMPSVVEAHRLATDLAAMAALPNTVDEQQQQQRRRERAGTGQAGSFSSPNTARRPSWQPLGLEFDSAAGEAPQASHAAVERLRAAGARRDSGGSTSTMLPGSPLAPQRVLPRGSAAASDPSLWRPSNALPPPGSAALDASADQPLQPPPLSHLPLPSPADEESYIRALSSVVSGRAKGTFRPVRVPSTDTQTGRQVSASSASSASSAPSLPASPRASTTVPSFAAGFFSSLAAGAFGVGGLRSHHDDTTAGSNEHLLSVAAHSLQSPRVGGEKEEVEEEEEEAHSHLGGGTGAQDEEEERARLAALQSSLFYQALYKRGRGEFVYDTEPLLSFRDLEEAGRKKTAADIALTPEEAEMYIDLRPYFDPTPITTHVHAPVARAFRLFRLLGLRHLIVTNDSADVVGIITRHELLDEALAESLHRVRQEELAAQHEEEEEEEEEEHGAHSIEMDVRGGGAGESGDEGKGEGAGGAEDPVHEWRMWRAMRA